MWFVLDLNPEPWAIGPVSVGRRGGKLYATVGQNAQLKAYQESIQEAIGEQAMLTGKVAIKFFFWRLRSEYESHQARTVRKNEADATNMQKATEDALQKVLFPNDKDVSDIRSVIVEQGPEVTPRIVLNVEPWFSLDPSDIPEFIWAQIEDSPNLFSESKTKLITPKDNTWGTNPNDDVQELF